MTCDTTEEEREDEYRTPDGMTQEERDLMEREVNLARSKAMAAAADAGRGPNSQEIAGHRAAVEAKNAAHDRFHLRQMAEAAANAADAKAVPVHAHVPAKGTG